MKFSIKDFFSKCLVTFTEEILIGKLHFLCSERLSLSFIRLSNFFLWCLKISYSVFSQSASFLGRGFQIKINILLSLLIDLLNLGILSSAKWWTLRNFMDWFIWLINIQIKFEWKTNSWRISNFTVARLES